MIKTASDIQQYNILYAIHKLLAAMRCRFLTAANRKKQHRGINRQKSNDLYS